MDKTDMLSAWRGGDSLKERRLRYRSPRILCAAYAKINLYLDVLGCREDGYHDLVSIMHTIDLHDDVTVQLFPADTQEVSLRVFGARLPTDRRNLVYRAAEAYLARTNMIASASVLLRKKLPVAAGIGGGSSDAAATLLAINRAAGGLLGKAELFALAAELGSDVPFCLAGGTQICHGRGEKMEPLIPARPLYAVLASGREYVSTPRAFAEMDEYYNHFDGSVAHGGDWQALARALQTGEGRENAVLYYNAFEPVILPSCPNALSLRAALKREGAYAVLMSGSGPSVFGLFSDLESARRAAATIGNGARAATSAQPPVPHEAKRFFSCEKDGSAEE